MTHTTPPARGRGGEVYTADNELSTSGVPTLCDEVPCRVPDNEKRES